MAALHGQQNSLTLPRSVEREMSRHMHLSLPQEACGVVLGESAAGGIRISRFQPIRNVAPDPLHHFSLDQSEWIQCFFSDVTIVGIFHTHPRTLPIPSQEDLQALPNFAGMIDTYLIGSPDLSISAPKECESSMLLNAYQIISDETHQRSESSFSLSPYNLVPLTLRMT
ncbi:M67 family metallopeptidase [Paenibacillus polysaccharolyticus]|uniref:Mov34/MPN/PAD-1 family protein n=1 Tax=Paenibacillus polysaccharolyticus TaxID=582692 RepID=UPI00204068F5|nr:M67 family metallopeptidase [Paenibacillus polysaccharolyticus]MCM3131718.1 M67 family metallopeptidase [Paenibacillus polysaccharolyticus]